MLRFAFLFVLQFTILCIKFSFSNANANALIGNYVEQAKDQEFPFVVSIGGKEPWYTRESNHICTGSLISKKHVLTAAHCFLNKNNPDKVQVLIGSANLRKSAEYPVASWITFTEWAVKKNILVDSKANHDIAILTLKETVYPVKVKPGVLSTKDVSDLYGAKATLVGWGRKESGEKRTFLQKTTVKILSNDECEKRLAKVLRRPKVSNPIRILCSVTDRASPAWVLTSCGDSGGPMLDENNAIIGVSEGSCPGNAINKKQVNSHFSVNVYRDFINDNIKNL